jgi:uncharacterized protein
MREPRVLSEGECRRLLNAGGVGRVAVNTPDGPHIVPVNYAVHDDAVVFRTTPCSILGTHGWRDRLAFEVDHLDHQRWRGWSVVAAGPGEIVEDADELAAIQTVWDPRPWAGGHRPLYIRLRWDRLTGRQIGEGWHPADEPPVRHQAGV